MALWWAAASTSAVACVASFATMLSLVMWWWAASPSSKSVGSRMAAPDDSVAIVPATQSAATASLVSAKVWSLTLAYVALAAA